MTEEQIRRDERARIFAEIATFKAKVFENSATIDAATGDDSKPVAASSWCVGAASRIVERINALPIIPVADIPTPEKPPAAEPKSDRQSLLMMLTGAGIGHGSRQDYKDGQPVGESVQMEIDDDETKHGFRITEFGFDETGTLKEVVTYPGEPG